MMSSRRRARAISAIDIGDLLTAKGYDAIKMVKTGEGFYSSLGFAPLPETFWTRSQFVKPADREVRVPRLGLGHRQHRTICASRCASR